MKAVIVDSKLLADDFNASGFEMEKMFFSERGIDLDLEDVVDEQDYLEKCRNADAILTVMRKTPRSVIEKLEKCKVIVRYGIGLDIIDVEAATENGIAVCSIPDYCIQEVATHAVALALDCLRKVTLCNERMKKGIWGEPSGYPTRRLSTLTLGLVGFGNIARQAAGFFAALGFKMIGYDPYVQPKTFDMLSVEKVNFEDLCKRSDVISIHVPLNDDTYQMINKESFAMMKEGVIIINTSRGAIVNQEELLDAIDSHIVAAAGLDVLETEFNINSEFRVFKYDNVIVTSHIGAFSVESISDLRRKVCETAAQVLHGDLPSNVVNRQSITQTKKA